MNPLQTGLGLAPSISIANHPAGTLFIKPQRLCNQLNLKEFLFIRKSILNLVLQLKIITVNNEAAHEGEWRKYLAEHDFKNWINLYEPVIERESRIKKGLASYQQLYNAYQTPTMYLLDKDKNILAKRLSLEQFDNMLKELNRKK